MHPNNFSKICLMETLKHQEIDMNTVCRSQHPAYIIAMHNEMLLFANDTALAANQKKLDEFVGENVATLSFPEELEKRNRLLQIDKKLTNYEYKAMNWYKDGDLWRRKTMNLVADIQVIEFGGRICRLGIDLMAEETNRFVD